MIDSKKQLFFVPVSLLALFLVAIFFRPLLPIDETRYMTAAWEMYLRQGWLSPLTVNFEPYHHKPPMLFWLINTSWSIFGVSRWAALVPIVLAAGTCVYLTQALARKLFKTEKLTFENLPFIMMGSVPFLIYNTLIMFDVTLTLFVLSALLALLSYAENRRFPYILLMALFLGLGVLTKGPVAWLYVVFPAILGPYWLSENNNKLSWYGGCALAFILSLLPVLLWLIPVLKASSHDFAFSLLWEQTAGRITGKMGNTHTRPLYFYLPLLPILFLPWAFFPSFWTGLNTIKTQIKTNLALRFILCWLIPVFITFSLIEGKQPHYLIPLLPGVLILISYSMKINLKMLAKFSIIMMMTFAIGQVLASKTIFQKYDLQPIADYIQKHEESDWAFIRKYQGELTFLGQLEHPMDSMEFNDLPEWFKVHPQGLAVIRYHEVEKIEHYKMVMTIPYRGKHIGIFKLASP